MLNHKKRETKNKDQMKKTASWQEKARIPMVVVGDPQ